MSRGFMRKGGREEGIITSENSQNPGGEGGRQKKTPQKTQKISAKGPSTENPIPIIHYSLTNPHPQLLHITSAS